MAKVRAQQDAGQSALKSYPSSNQTLNLGRNNMDIAKETQMILVPQNVTLDTS